MTPEKIISVIEMYEDRLNDNRIPKVRLDPKRTFQSATIPERLAHAHYLCDGVKEYAKNPEKQRKTGSHLTAVQMCLSFAGWYTLEDLMNHNRPASETVAPANSSVEFVRQAIGELKLSVRVETALRAHNILYLDEVAQLTKSERQQILRTRKAVAEVEAALAARGFKLAD